MSPSPSDPAVELARHIRAELSDPPPQGFRLTDQVVRQDAALGRLIERLSAHPARAEVERAVALALEEEPDGWPLLKVLELVDRLALAGTAPALIRIAESKGAAADDRSRFVAGRACEVMLKLPLDLKTRAVANAACQLPLQEVARFRASSERVQDVHRPKRTEWALLVALMLLGLGGLVYAFLAGR